MSTPTTRKMKQQIASEQPPADVPMPAAEPQQVKQEQQEAAPAEQPHSNGNTLDASAPQVASETAAAAAAAAPPASDAAQPATGNGTDAGPAPQPDGQQHQDQIMQDADPAPNDPEAQQQGADLSASGAVSSEDIQLVQNLIERCLQLYMTREEVISVLKDQATIESRFTQLVWQKLEEQNPEFFSCYYTRLKLKAQIVTFNHLLEQQVQVVQRMQRGWMSGGMGGSATASGIPLFQGGPGSSGGQQSGDGQHRPRDQVVPDPHGHEDFGFPSLDGAGASPLFGTLPHIGSEPELENLGAHNMPTPGELEHSLTFLPTTSPLNAHAAHLKDLELPRDPGGAAGGSMPRSFSLSELAHLDAEENKGGGKAS